MTTLRTDGVVAADPPSEAFRVEGIEVSFIEPLAIPPPIAGRFGGDPPIGSLTDRLFRFVRPDADAIALLRADRQTALLASLLDEADQTPCGDEHLTILEDICADLDELMRRCSALVEG